MIAEALGLLLMGAAFVGLIVWLNKLDPESPGKVTEGTRRRYQK